MIIYHWITEVIFKTGIQLCRLQIAKNKAKAKVDFRQISRPNPKFRAPQLSHLIE